jgi:hypothetical protein
MLRGVDVTKICCCLLLLLLYPAGYPVVQVPHMNDLEAWDRTCFGHAAQAEARHVPAAAGAEMTQLTPGICSKIMALEQVG